MYVVIAGGGGLGRELAKRLLRLDSRFIDVTVIDVNPKVCEEIRQELGVNVVEGDATNTTTLTRARIQDADVFLALTGNEAVNLVASILAKHLGARRVVTRCERQSFVEVCQRIGLGEVFRPAQIAAVRIAARLMGFYLTDLLILSERFVDVEEVSVDEKPELLGKTVKELSEELPSNAHVALIMQGSKPVIPKRDVELKNGMKVILVKVRGE